MSLLMDALKRAETSKQEAARALTGRDAVSHPDEALSLEPITNEPVKFAGSPLPELAKHLEAVDADLATTAQPETPSRPRPVSPAAPTAAEQATQSGRDAVRNAFTAKQSAPPSKAPLWLALGTLGLAGIAIGGYVWYQLNNMSGNTLAPSSVRPPVASAMAPQSVAPAVPVNQIAVFANSGPSTAADSPASAETRLFAPPPPRPSRALPAEREVAPEPPIRLTRTKPEPDANLMRGYANVQSNDLEFARRDFEQALQRDPNNTDALLSLAAIAQRQGRPADAEGLYQRAVIANPSDPAVQGAALNGAVAGADPQNTESRLKTLLAGQPDSAPLNFALGNLYARQKRWSEAQQVYFNAVAVDSDNPDYLFNLAVSLDHIRQARPAAQHYRLALEAAEKRPSAFNRDQVRKRLIELHP
ncbi:MAG: tetratricopeptide repeat protein [Azonexus sp.]|nr:tetratricopeptide repeat protein [Azonexus sp.]